MMCTEKFDDNPSLRQHYVDAHDDKKPFLCTNCGTGFTTSGKLKMHIEAVHEGKKDFSCFICKKEFYSKNRQG